MQKAMALDLFNYYGDVNLFALRPSERVPKVECSTNSLSKTYRDSLICVCVDSLSEICTH